MFGAAYGSLGAIGATYGSQCYWCCLWFLVLLVLPMVIGAPYGARCCFEICIVDLSYLTYLFFRRLSVLYIAYFSQIHRVSFGMASIFASLNLLFYNVKSVRLIHVFPDQYLTAKLTFLVFFG